MISLTVAWDDLAGLVNAHERFLTGARVDADVRGSVLDSWKRCRFAGLEPDRLLVPYAPDLELDDQLLLAADPVLKELTASLAEVSMTVALCDERARMVKRYDGDRQLSERLDEVRFAPGCDISEQVAGTNGVGTALAGRSPIYLVGREHFADCLQPFACAGAPIRNPLSGRVEAVLDLTCLRDDGDPAMLRLVRDAVRAIEARLLEQATERERALLAAYRRADRESDIAGGRQPRREHVPTEHEAAHGSGALDRIDLAVLRERAEELIAAPHRTLDEVALTGGRTATLLRRQVVAAAGETGVVVEARILGGPRLRHTELAPTAAPAEPVPATASTSSGPPTATALAAPPPPPAPVPEHAATPPVELRSCPRVSSASSPGRSPGAGPEPTPPRAEPAPTAGCCSSASPASAGWRYWPAGAWSCCTTPASASAPPSRSPAPRRS